jgi:hypothetical protein
MIDLTCGKESYGMRYMYCARPSAGTNTTIIDFNQVITLIHSYMLMWLYRQLLARSLWCVVLCCYLSQ